jgi:Major capsid protein Gp23
MNIDRYVDSAPSIFGRDRGRQLLEKWGDMLDFEDEQTPRIAGHHKRLSTAMLLENQEKWLKENGFLMENNVSGGTGGVFTGYKGTVDAGAYGNTGPGQYTYGGQVGDRPHPLDGAYAPGDARLPSTLIPMIRRTFPELISNELFGIQPMSGPVGLAFALRYIYESDNLAELGPMDGSASSNANVTGHRSDGIEAGYNYLNTAHTGITAEGFSGLGVQTAGATAATSDFDFIADDQGVAEILANFEFTNAIPQMTLTIEKTAVEAGTRRLATKFPLELEQDLKAMNGLEIDAEMTNAMSYELAAEIDRELIIRALQVCLNAGLGVGYSTWSPEQADGRWFAERGVDFYAKIIVESNRMAIRNRRGAANFIVATPSVCAILTLLPEFNAFNINASVDRHPHGIAKLGNLAGQFNIYRDTRMEAQYAVGSRAARLEYALLGYKGSEFWDTGIVYCPYIPVVVQRTVGPNDFGFRIGMMTRYGVVDNLFGAENFYHLIIAKNLDQQFSTSVYNTTPTYLG